MRTKLDITPCHPRNARVQCRIFALATMLHISLKAADCRQIYPPHRKQPLLQHSMLRLCRGIPQQHPSEPKPFMCLRRPGASPISFTQAASPEEQRAQLLAIIDSLLNLAPGVDPTTRLQAQITSPNPQTQPGPGPQPPKPSPTAAIVGGVDPDRRPGSDAQHACFLRSLSTLCQRAQAGSCGTKL